MRALLDAPRNPGRFNLIDLAFARGRLPTEDAALKLLWLALRSAEKKWTHAIRDWPRAAPVRESTLPDRVAVAS